MSQKRPQREESTSYDERRPRKSKSFKSVVLEVMSLCKLLHLMEPVLEPIIRRVVREEVDSALKKYIINMKRNSGKDMTPSEARSLCLQFNKSISLPVFTGTRIEGEGCTRLEVSLIDSLTGEVVSTGLGSSSKVEIVVLEGDFDGDGTDNWTIVEFQNNTVRERKGKKPLLSGDLITTLQDGEGFVGNVIFTDNSSWTRSRKFRLGARFLDSIGGIRVREARSEAFVVRDHRGELYKKHHPPSLSDEIWRLEKIGKDGAFHKRLRKERINTVEDFLLSLSLDPARLRNILGAGMSTKTWEVAVEHAKTCVLDQKLHFYGVSQENGVVFNVVGQVKGTITNRLYVDADKLSEAEKTEAHELVISAFADRDKIVPFHDDSNPPTSIVLSQTGFHGDLSSQPYFEQNASTPDYMHSVEGLTSFEDCLHHVDSSVGIGSPQRLDYTLDETFGADELQFFERDCAIQSSPFELPAAAYIPCPDVSIDRAQRGWNILVFVLRWWFLIKRRLVARKTRS